MGWSAITAPWTDDRDAELCRRLAAGETMGEIGTAMRASRNAISGRINRLRRDRDPRVPPAGPSPIESSPAKPIRRSPDFVLRDRVAQVMADGCPSLTAAAHQLRCSIDEVEGAWRTIRRKLGPQAA